MSKDGYLQTKIKELEEKVGELQNRLEDATHALDRKEAEIDRKKNTLQKALDRYDEKIEKRKTEEQEARDTAESLKSLINKKVLKAQKENLKHLLAQINTSTQEIEDSLLDAAVHGILLTRLLAKKGVLDSNEEYLKYWRQHKKDAKESLRDSIHRPRFNEDPQLVKGAPAHKQEEDNHATPENRTK